jgi:SAM-dependent methyltransferase
MAIDPDTRAVLRQWSEKSERYRDLITDSEEDSSYLREVGLKPTILRLLGDCAEKRLLDVGTGSGWLFDLVKPKVAYACDFVPSGELPAYVNFSIQDANSLEYADKSFDVIVSSLMLCYCADLERVLRELWRVADSGGQLIASLVHPYFYRTGTVRDNGELAVNVDLSRENKFPINIGNKVGPFDYFYRPYPSYLNTFVGAGWHIDHVEDWFIDADSYFARFGSKGSVPRTDKVPTFAFIKCSRS